MVYSIAPSDKRKLHIRPTSLLFVIETSMAVARACLAWLHLFCFSNQKPARFLTNCYVCVLCVWYHLVKTIHGRMACTQLMFAGIAKCISPPPGVTPPIHDVSCVTFAELKGSRSSPANSCRVGVRHRIFGGCLMLSSWGCSVIRHIATKSKLL